MESKQPEAEISFMPQATILNVLACPLCGSRLLVDPEHYQLVCHADRVGYTYSRRGVDMRVEYAVALTRGE